MIDVSIIIVNYNTSELTLSCIKSIIDLTENIAYEIIVVDNASSDSSCEMIESIFPNVILLKNSINLGFGTANNLGVRHSQGKYVFLLNSDTKFLNNALQFFYEFYENNSFGHRIGIVGTELLNSDLLPTHSSGFFPVFSDIIKRTLKINFNKDVFIDKNKGYLVVEYITGANLFIEKRLFDDFSGFDEDFFMYYEETDLQKRFALNGYKSVLIAGPKIIHFQGKSFVGQNSIRKITMEYNGFFLYHYKHTSFFLYFFIRLFYILFRMPILLVRSKNNKEIKSIITIFFKNPHYRNLNL
jgi:GT2 family glycosyltransferase